MTALHLETYASIGKGRYPILTPARFWKAHAGLWVRRTASADSSSG